MSGETGYFVVDIFCTPPLEAEIEALAQRAHDRHHAIVDADRARYEAGEITHRVTLGEVVERALAALEREIGR